MQRLPIDCVRLPNTDGVGAKHDERGKMAEATARAASIKRYGEALGDPALAERWVATSSAAVDVDAWRGTDFSAIANLLDSKPSPMMESLNAMAMKMQTIETLVAANVRSQDERMDLLDTGLTSHMQAAKSTVDTHVRESNCKV